MSCCQECVIIMMLEHVILDKNNSHDLAGIQIWHTAYIANLNQRGDNILTWNRMLGYWSRKRSMNCVVGMYCGLRLPIYWALRILVWPHGGRQTITRWLVINQWMPVNELLSRMRYHCIVRRSNKYYIACHSFHYKLESTWWQHSHLI